MGFQPGGDGAVGRCGNRSPSANVTGEQLLRRREGFIGGFDEEQGCHRSAALSWWRRCLIMSAIAEKLVYTQVKTVIQQWEEILSCEGGSPSLTSNYPQSNDGLSRELQAFGYQSGNGDYQRGDGACQLQCIDYRVVMEHLLVTIGFLKQWRPSTFAQRI
ncbi:hypothetical protein HAX54_043187 [Datura stramonium]|uniref:Uncharacterized protein n=1 Tax=Datura stramonium TaxID=4076 RepID=A0ABS8W4D4_DATST|nr:hypothetical protein [Datura stramonium]